MTKKLEPADRQSGEPSAARCHHDLTPLAGKDDPIHVEYLKLALDEARKCVPTPTAFCVGCLIIIPGIDLTTAASLPVPPEISEHKDVLSTGYSRELPGNTHAEANALTKIQSLKTVKVDGEDVSVEDLLVLSDVYTTLEPCSVRLSGLAPCADALIKARIKRCFVGVAEPTDFVECEGQRKLMEAGIEVVRVKGLEDECLAVARTGHDGSKA